MCHNSETVYEYDGPEIILDNSSCIALPTCNPATSPHRARGLTGVPGVVEWGGPCASHRVNLLPSLLPWAAVSVQPLWSYTRSLRPREMAQRATAHVDLPIAVSGAASSYVTARCLKDRDVPIDEKKTTTDLPRRSAHSSSSASDKSYSDEQVSWVRIYRRSRRCPFLTHY
jgi:hypothetical protein